MRCSLDKILTDARTLANRIRATDEAADQLIKQASSAHNKIIAKKQCQEEIMTFEELTQMVKGRPRSRLMMCIAAENKQLELLRQENKVLRTSLNEYETTFEMIMNKFRKHKIILKKLDQLERGDFKSCQLYSKSSFCDCDSRSRNKIICLCAKLSDLKQAIEKALVVDDKVSHDLTEMEIKLTLENGELRRLVKISGQFHNELIKVCGNNESQRTLTTNPKLEAGFIKDKSVVVNGVVKNPDKSPCSTVSSRDFSSVTPMISVPKAPFKVFNHIPKFSYQPNHSNNIYDDTCTLQSDDDDDHSSIASDASVKTLI